MMVLELSLLLVERVVERMLQEVVGVEDVVELQ
jgi:hypothetical protein